MKILRQKISLIIIGALIVTTALTGCGSSSKGGTTASTGAKASSEPVTLKYVASKDTSPAIKKSIEEFEAENPNIKIDFEELSGNSDDVKKSLSISLAAGDSDPDVFAADIIWVPQFAAAGWLLDVTDELTSIKDKYLAGPLLTCQYNNKYYALPNYTDVGLLYYRKDLISTPPKTWDDLVKLSKEHIGKDGIEYGYVYQAFQGEPVVCNALEFIKQNGGDDLKDGKFVINSKNSADALKFMRSLIDTGISPEGVLAHKPADSRPIFEEGKALFMRNWTFEYANAEADTSKVKGKVGVAILPVGPDGKDSAGTLGGWNIGINAKTDHKEEAIKFAKFMSGEKAQKNSTITSATFPTLKATYDEEEVKKALPHLQTLKTALEQAKPRPQVSDYSAISTIMQGYLHKALTLDEPYEQALKELQDELNAAYEKQKK